MDKVYERTGLSLIIKLNRIWGFRLGDDKHTGGVVNRWLTAFELTSSIFALCICCPTLYVNLVMSKKEFDYENACLWLVISLGYVASIANYVDSIVRAKHHSTLIRSLASAIDAIPNEKARINCVRRVRLVSFGCLIPILASNIFVLVFHMVKDEFGLVNAFGDRILFKILDAINMLAKPLWVITTGSYYVYTNCLITILCRTIMTLADTYLSEDDDDEPKAEKNDVWASKVQSPTLKHFYLSRKIIVHQKMSRIVNEANDVFTNFLFISVSLELVISIAYVKITTMKSGDFSFTAHLNTIQMCLLIWKAMYCSAVNDKLKSSLTPKNPSLTLEDLNYFTVEQAHYQLYLSQQNVNKAEFSYGGFFPVRRSIIFTIGGTALTYALVLQGING